VFITMKSLVENLVGSTYSIMICVFLVLSVFLIQLLVLYIFYHNRIKLF